MSDWLILVGLFIAGAAALFVTWAIADSASFGDDE